MEGRWEEDQWSAKVFSERAERMKADDLKRRSGRKIIRKSEVNWQWEPNNGIWVTGLVTREMGFENRIIEVDMHVLPPGSHSITHKHNEAILHILRGQGYTLIDEERFDWSAGDTVYIPIGAWHQHFNLESGEPAVILAIKPIPLQEYLGEVHIERKGDKPKINETWKPDSLGF